MSDEQLEVLFPESYCDIIAKEEQLNIEQY